MILLKNSRRRKGLNGALQWSIEDWISILAREGGQKKRFQYCLNPDSSRQILYCRSIQRHSGGIAIDSELQDNVLLPKEFTEYIHHVGNVSEMHSIIRSGLILGGQSLKRGRQSVFFTVVNPMDDDSCLEETPCDLTKPRIAPYKKTWKTSSKYGILVQFETCSRERIAILPNTVARIRPLQHTTSGLHRESGMHEGKG